MIAAPSTGIYMAEDSTNFLKVTAPTRYDGVFAVLVFSDTVDKHSVVIGSFPVVECYLAHFLSHFNFRKRFAVRQV